MALVSVAAGTTSGLEGSSVIVYLTASFCAAIAVHLSLSLGAPSWAMELNEETVFVLSVSVFS